MMTLHFWHSSFPCLKSLEASFHFVLQLFQKLFVLVFIYNLVLNVRGVYPKALSWTKRWALFFIDIVYYLETTSLTRAFAEQGIKIRITDNHQEQRRFYIIITCRHFLISIRKVLPMGVGLSNCVLVGNVKSPMGVLAYERDGQHQPFNNVLFFFLVVIFIFRFRRNSSILIVHLRLAVLENIPTQIHYLREKIPNHLCRVFP